MILGRSVSRDLIGLSCNMVLSTINHVVFVLPLKSLRQMALEWQTVISPLDIIPFSCHISKGKQLGALGIEWLGSWVVTEEWERARERKER